MINKVKHTEEPTLFDDIQEFEVDRIQDHRRGSSFWVELIIEFKPEHAKYYPNIKDFEKYVGTWKTDQVIYDDNWGFDDNFSELTRVEAIEIITYDWKEV